MSVKEQFCFELISSLDDNAADLAYNRLHGIKGILNHC
jgi:hypothetical protein